MNDEAREIVVGSRWRKERSDERGIKTSKYRIVFGESGEEVDMVPRIENAQKYVDLKGGKPLTDFECDAIDLARYLPDGLAELKLVEGEFTLVFSDSVMKELGNAVREGREISFEPPKK